MSYVGDFSLGSTFDVKFTTVNTSGVPTTLAGTPVISAYPDNSLTELTAGITLSVDFDGRTGMHNIRVVATSGNGYAAGSNYSLVITTGTVGGNSVVGYVVGEFSIEARSAVRPTTAGRTLAIESDGMAHADVKEWLGVAPDVLSSGKVPADIKLWLAVAPDALSSGKVPADLKLWLAAAPAALTANGYVQAMLLRWLTDNAAGTPGALIGNRVDSHFGALGGVVQSATDLKDFADDGYDPATNKVQGVVLVDTTTTVTGGATAAALADVQTDTDNIQSRLPAALTAAGNLKADVEEWLAGIIPAPNVTGVPKVDLVDIDGAATNGNNATLKLKQLNIYNNSATAVEIISEVAEAVYIESEAGKGVFVLGTTGGIVGQGTNSPGIAGRSLGAFPDAGIFAEGLQGLFVIGTNDGILATGGTGKSISALQDIAVSDGSLTLTAIANKVWATVWEAALTAGTTRRLVWSAPMALQTKTGIFLPSAIWLT